MPKSNVELWRSVTHEDYPDGTITNGEPVPGVLFPDFVERVLPTGRIRNADVQQFSGSDGQD